jgi:hypothetical protein
VIPCRKIEHICSVNVKLKIAICHLCDLFTEAKCFLFTDGVSVEHHMYYISLKRKNHRDGIVIHTSNCRYMTMFVSDIVRSRRYYSSTLYKCVCVCVCVCTRVCVSNVFNNSASCVISGHPRSVIEIFAHLEFYAAQIDSYQRFGTTCRFSLQRSIKYGTNKISRMSVSNNTRCVVSQNSEDPKTNQIRAWSIGRMSRTG